MARRSPLNERYKKGPQGKTRKSASSARLKRRESEQPKKSERPRLGLVPQTPEMKRWRRIWWVLMGIAVALALTTFLQQARENETIVRYIFGAELVALAAAMWIDWVKIRPLRQKAVEEAKRQRKEK